MGAAGAVEAIASVINTESFIPPTLAANADPECDLDYVPNEGRSAVKVALSILGFGGHNGDFYLARWSNVFHGKMI